MKIDSDFRDYYDVGVSWDHEPVPRYHRITQRVSFQKHPGLGWRIEGEPSSIHQEVMTRLDPLLSQRPRFYHDWVEPITLGFCGRYVPGWRSGTDTFWSVEDLRRRLSGYDPEFRRVQFSESEQQRFLEGLAALGPAPFRKLQAPVFLLVDKCTSVLTYELVVNPCLQDLRCMSWLDAYTAWQSLDQYLSNALAHQPDPPNEISDVLRRDIHGFDERSFQAAPGGPNRKRKKRS